MNPYEVADYVIRERFYLCILLHNQSCDGHLDFQLSAMRFLFRQSETTKNRIT